jgi:UDP-glucuronate 4-epimerase
MNSIVITGAAGFIGSNLVRALLKAGNKVIGIDNFDAFYDPRLKRANIAEFSASPLFVLHEGDIRDKGFMHKVLREAMPRCVVHLAAKAGVRPSIEDPEAYYDVNVRGTLTVLEVMKELKISNMVFASSSSVYGNNRKTPFSETDNVDFPISPYAATKKAGELLCFNYHHLYNLNVFCLRFFTVYGVNQRPEMAIRQFGKLISEGKPVTMYGDGTTRRDYTYIDDIVSGIMASIERVKGYEIINLGNNKTVELNYLIHLIGRTLGNEVIINKLPMQPGDVELTYADISKANELLGYNPLNSIEEGLKKMFNV